MWDMGKTLTHALFFEKVLNDTSYRSGGEPMDSVPLSEKHCDAYAGLALTHHACTQEVGVNKRKKKKKKKQCATI